MQPIAPWEIILAARISESHYRRVLEILKEYDNLKARSVGITVNQFRKYMGHKPANHPNATVGASLLTDADTPASLNTVVPQAALDAVRAELIDEYSRPEREFDRLDAAGVAARFPRLFEN